MKKLRLVLCLLLFLPSLLAPERSAQSATSLWQTAGEGIEYREFYLDDPNRVYVARMKRNNPLVTIESSIGQGRLSGGGETVSGMAQRYDEAIGYWDGDWGTRNQVEVAINGYFYDPNTGIPYRGQMQSGWYAKQFDDLENGSGFSWTMDRDAFIGGCVRHKPTKQLVIHVATGEKQFFHGINVPRGENELIIYTPQFDAHTYTDNTGLEILVEMSRPMLIIPEPAMITGTVREIRDMQGSTYIPFDHIVLSASGTIRDSLLTRVKVGDEIGISQDVSSFKSDCVTPIEQSWEASYAGIGGSYHFLKAGVIQGFNEVGAVVRNPRTAVAFEDKHIFFIVVDGRDPYRSVGMSIVELAAFAKNKLGAIEGVALDGGGSSTIVVNGEVKNNPNADLPRSYKIYLPLTLNGEATASGPGMLVGDSTSGLSFDTTYTPSDKLERAVANGLMMVTVLRMEQSTTYQTNTQVVITGTLASQVRLGPGTNYAALTILPPGSEGVIAAHELNGVLAKGSYWWKVKFGDVAGWAPEDVLAPAIR